MWFHSISINILQKRINNGFFDNCWLLPIVGVILLQSMLVTVYMLAILKSNIDPVLPFLSEAATFGPQAGLFSQFLSILAFIELLTFIVRYEQIKCLIKRRIIDEKHLNKIKKINRLNAVFGILHSLLMPSVGNFRTTEYPTIHLLCAMILILIFNLNVLTTIYLTKYFFHYDLESRPTSMTINGFLYTITNLSLAGSAFITELIENPSNTIFVDEFSILHNISAILQWLSFSQMSFHMICLANRMRQFRKNDEIVQK